MGIPLPDASDVIFDDTAADHHGAVYHLLAYSRSSKNPSLRRDQQWPAQV